MRGIPSEYIKNYETKYDWRATYAQADGVALRLRLADSLTAGVLGGFSGNPYNYNWRLQMTQDFSSFRPSRRRFCFAS